MKLDLGAGTAAPQSVAPLAGAWIEIDVYNQRAVRCGVAPLAGAWIEILKSSQSLSKAESLPSRERGLKWTVHNALVQIMSVAPLAGAWIEMP